jgi:hypothetical protein
MMVKQATMGMQAQHFTLVIERKNMLIDENICPEIISYFDKENYV